MASTNNSQPAPDGAAPNDPAQDVDKQLPTIPMAMSDNISNTPTDTVAIEQSTEEKFVRAEDNGGNSKQENTISSMAMDTGGQAHSLPPARRPTEVQQDMTAVPVSRKQIKAQKKKFRKKRSSQMQQGSNLLKNSQCPDLSLSNSPGENRKERYKYQKEIPDQQPQGPAIASTAMETNTGKPNLDEKDNKEPAHAVDKERKISVAASATASKGNEAEIKGGLNVDQTRLDEGQKLPVGYEREVAIPVSLEQTFVKERLPEQVRQQPGRKVNTMSGDYSFQSRPFMEIQEMRDTANSSPRDPQHQLNGSNFALLPAGNQYMINTGAQYYTSSNVINNSPSGINVDTQYAAFSNPRYAVQYPSFGVSDRSFESPPGLLQHRLSLSPEQCRFSSSERSSLSPNYMTTSYSSVSPRPGLLQHRHFLSPDQFEFSSSGRSSLSTNYMTTNYSFESRPSFLQHRLSISPDQSRFSSSSSSSPSPNYTTTSYLSPGSPFNMQQQPHVNQYSRAGAANSRSPSPGIWSQSLPGPCNLAGAPSPGSNIQREGNVLIVDEYNRDYQNPFQRVRQIRAALLPPCFFPRERSRSRPHQYAGDDQLMLQRYSSGYSSAQDTNSTSNSSRSPMSVSRSRSVPRSRSGEARFEGEIQGSNCGSSEVASGASKVVAEYSPVRAFPLRLEPAEYSFESMKEKLPADSNFFYESSAKGTPSIPKEAEAPALPATSSPLISEKMAEAVLSSPSPAAESRPSCPKNVGETAPSSASPAKTSPSLIRPKIVDEAGPSSRASSAKSTTSFTMNVHAAPFTPTFRSTPFSPKEAASPAKSIPLIPIKEDPSQSTSSRINSASTNAFYEAVYSRLKDVPFDKRQELGLPNDPTLLKDPDALFSLLHEPVVNALMPRPDVRLPIFEEICPSSSPKKSEKQKK